MRYAYATFLMRGDGYLPGALVLAYALKLHTKIECICLVTDDVSGTARNALYVLYDSVIPIEPLALNNTVQGGRNDRKLLPTRFQALRLYDGGGLGKAYDKIILLDADILPMRGYDNLFLLNTPAGILMENKAICYSGGHVGKNTYNHTCKNTSGDKCDNTNEKWSWHKHYEAICPHGSLIPKNITSRVQHDTDNMGVNAGIWVLAPSAYEYHNICQALQDPQTQQLAATFPWPEMQLATLLWSGRWTNIDIRYGSINGYPRLDALYGIHYAGIKPWQRRNRSIQHYAAFPDFRLWYGYFNAMYWTHTELRSVPGLQKLWGFCKEIK